ncbi:hypothetical protein G6Y98_02180 [Clostridium perfringens]|uniref:hypothetical protein n=1 Tax=Clostridium perfringens TaxID=1502 RepID=UPI0013E288B5|nr:hypothetical protein [Clostridium perfringens]MDH2475905.1 hypothetical protein [Clostridium perfringens]NGT94634.1 hypothetical protein [Clostridium perfringens]
MSKYKILNSRIKNVFTEFYINEEFEEYPYIDLDKTNKKLINNRWFGIDSFPKQMEAESSYEVLDVFWDLDKDKTNYLKQEEKFIRAVLLIMSYSKDIIISSDYYFSENKKYINRVLGKKDLEHLKVIKDAIFDIREIEYDYYAINSLIKIALRERSHLSIYMLDVEIMLEVNGLYSNVYLGGKGNIEIVKYICNVEGLYIRDRSSERI